MPSLLVVCYPVIIFDGKMYEYVLDEKEEPKLTEILDLLPKSISTGRLPNYRYDYRGETKEIDLWAYFNTDTRRSKKNQNLQWTLSNMIIECKKSETKPWVFFSPHEIYKGQPLASSIKYVSEFDPYLSKGTFPLLTASYFAKIETSLQRWFVPEMCHIL